MKKIDKKDARKRFLRGWIRFLKGVERKIKEELNIKPMKGYIFLTK